MQFSVLLVSLLAAVVAARVERLPTLLDSRVSFEDPKSATTFKIGRTLTLLRMAL